MFYKIYTYTCVTHCSFRWCQIYWTYGREREKADIYVSIMSSVVFLSISWCYVKYTLTECVHVRWHVMSNLVKHTWDVTCEYTCGIYIQHCSAYISLMNNYANSSFISPWSVCGLSSGLEMCITTWVCLGNLIWHLKECVSL